MLNNYPEETSFNVSILEEYPQLERTTIKTADGRRCASSFNFFFKVVSTGF